MAANIPTASNSILVDTPDAGAKSEKPQAGGELAGWLVSRADTWTSYRDRGYAARWGEYWRMWRGMWASDDANRASERSRLIAPALSQAIEMTVAELEEGLFSKEIWFDVVDDIADEDKLDAVKARDQLLEDLNLVNAKDNISEALLVGSIYGTSIVKLNVEVTPDLTPVRDPKTKELSPSGEDKVSVTIESIRPDEFIPDPAGQHINEMLGCFHQVKKPLHSILEKIEQGIYLKSALHLLGNSAVYGQEYGQRADQSEEAAYVGATDSDTVEILEYHGKVPVDFLNEAMEDRTELDAILKEHGEISADAGEDSALVEAIVTIGNGNVILRAKANPFTMKDRSIVAWQFEKVPGRFWGRGVGEKGYNPQKALDAEMRSRIDALGYVSSPMIGVDSGRIPRGFKMDIKPGKVWLTQGDPNEVIRPVAIGAVNQATFSQTGEMEKMVQMGTGAFDTASGIKSGAAAQGQQGSTSMMMGAFVKRAKRAIRNANDSGLAPIIKKAMWRYMQFAATRYPTDFKFSVKPTLGIVAREVEAMQLTQLMAMLPDQYPQVNLTIAQGILELSTVHNKAQIMEAFAAANQPPSEEEQKKQAEMEEMQLEVQRAQAESQLLLNQKTIAEIKEIMAKTAHTDRKTDVEDDKVQQEQQRIAIQDQSNQLMAEQNDIALMRLKLQERQIESKLVEMRSKDSK